MLLLVLSMRSGIWLSGLVLKVVSVVAQPLTVETASKENGEKEAVRQFEITQAGTHHLYTGAAYLPYTAIGKEHPYFLENKLYIGRVKCDGVWYTGVPLRFDLERSVLAVPYFFGGTPIQLVNEFVDAFEIDNHFFTHIRRGINPEGIVPGFYEVLAEGKVSLFVEHRKILVETVIDLEIKRQFNPLTRYFILKDGVQMTVTNRRFLLKLLQDRRTQLRPLLRQNSKATMAEIVSYYNSVSF